MTRGVRSALRALTLVGTAAAVLSAQEPVTPPRRLPLDLARLAPMARDYDIILLSRDSAAVIGTRTVAVQRSTYAGSAAWAIVETRVGTASGAESLYVSLEMNPIHLTANVGGARLGLQFVRDSVYGAVSTPVGRRSILLAGARALLPTAAMVEAILPLLPLASGWSDSAAVLSVDPATARVLPAQFVVLGTEPSGGGGESTPLAWVVALQTEGRYVLFWMDQQSGVITRVQQALERGVFLEYRLRSGSPSTAPPP